MAPTYFSQTNLLVYFTPTILSSLPLCFSPACLLLFLKITNLIFTLANVYICWFPCFECFPPDLYIACSFSLFRALFKCHLLSEDFSNLLREPELALLPTSCRYHSLFFFIQIFFLHRTWNYLKMHDVFIFLFIVHLP